MSGVAFESRVHVSSPLTYLALLLLLLLRMLLRRPEPCKQVHSCVFHAKTNLLVLGFTSGVFGLYTMPGCQNIHTLSVSQNKIDTVVLNPTGDWLAMASATLGQLLVWEWESETYVMKQQGHFFDLNVVAYSADGQHIATGGDDGKIKMWNTNTGFCFVTFAEHEAPISALTFTSKETGNAVISASLDGTVRAYDIQRYRNFRTMTTPEGSQLTSLAVDGGGEVICAGAFEPFNIFVWSLRTGRLLDILSGHEGPIQSLSFSCDSVLCSGAWDKVRRLWNNARVIVGE